MTWPGMKEGFALRGVSKTYTAGRTAVKALNDIWLGFDAGEFMAVAGPSGSGKSTLLHVLGCLVTPSAGEVVIDHELVLSAAPRLAARLRRHKIGFVFQDACLVPTLTAAQNVEYPLVLLRTPSSRRTSLVAQALADVGLKHRARHYPEQLSGGERQRVALARALVKHPPLVIADEPTANLDSQNAQDIIALMAALNREQNMTFVFSTHDERILRNVRRIVHLRDGEIVNEGL